MAKVTITIEDQDVAPGAIGVNFEFTPALPDAPEEGSGEETPQLTPAQTMAAYINQLISSASTPETDEEASGNEGCTQTNEGTCCGGDCNAPADG
jgi:hypothetical protein